MRNRDEGIETIFAAYAEMSDEKKQKFTQVTAAMTSGLPAMSDVSMTVLTVPTSWQSPNGRSPCPISFMRS